MSLSPTDIEDRQALDHDSQFMQNQNRLYRFLREGKSFSGHERNCCYLNLGTGSFADISAISGFDFLDDARATALVDWDQDGDLDVWVTNRNAPRARFLRNDVPSENDSLAIRLQGKTCNRDAIGAQVRVEFLAADKPPLMRTLRAGEGFLAQSSKWLTFGLGKGREIKQVVVVWPGGRSESFAGLVPNARYELTEGLEPVATSHRSAIKLSSTAVDGYALPARPSGLLHRPLPMPAIPYVDRNGRAANFATGSGRPMLVNLWASWCQPCLVELSEWKAQRDEFDAAGIDVLALSVDGLDDSVAGDDGAAGDDPARADLHALEALARLPGDGIMPGTAGAATTKTLDLLQLIHNQLFGIHRPLPLPTSLLLTSTGDLAAVYKGPVDFDDLVRDVQQLEEQPGKSAPFSGKWLREPKYDPLFVVSKLVGEGYLDEAQAYLKRHADRLIRGTRYADVIGQMGAVYVGREQYGAAESLFRTALKWKPNNAVLHNDLGGVLQMQNRLPAAIIEFRRAVELNSKNASMRANLAAALVQDGKTSQAIEQLHRALIDEPDNIPVLLKLADVLQASRQQRTAAGVYAKVVKLSPENFSARMNLGAILMTTGNTKTAIEHLRVARDLSPDDPGVRKNLGLALAIEGLTSAAIEEFRAALQLRPEDAAAQNNLGGLLIKEGLMQEAVSHFREAVKLAPTNAKYRNNLEAGEKMLAEKVP